MYFPFFLEEGDTRVDDNAHGTHIAGIIVHRGQDEWCNEERVGASGEGIQQREGWVKRDCGGGTGVGGEGWREAHGGGTGVLRCGDQHEP